MISDEYAAGFFDGEGSVYITYKTRVGGRKYHSVQINVHNSVPGVIEEFQAKYGGTIRSYQPKGGKRAAHRWTIEGRTALDFLLAVKPYCIVKLPQICLAIEYIETISPHNSGNQKIDMTEELWNRREDIRKRLSAFNHKGPDISEETY